MSHLIPTTLAILGLLFSLFVPTDAVAATAQEKCINALNKDF